MLEAGGGGSGCQDDVRGSGQLTLLPPAFFMYRWR